MLVGVNHHHQTVVFGCALLMDESIGTYEWVLETFLIAMMNKRPIFIVIDGNKAMLRQLKSPSQCMSSNGISNKMHSQMCILRTSQTPLQGACS